MKWLIELKWTRLTSLVGRRLPLRLPLTQSLRIKPNCAFKSNSNLSRYQKAPCHAWDQTTFYLYLSMYKSLKLIACIIWYNECRFNLLSVWRIRTILTFSLKEDIWRRNPSSTISSICSTGKSLNTRLTSNIRRWNNVMNDMLSFTNWQWLQN